MGMYQDIVAPLVRVVIVVEVRPGWGGQDDLYIRPRECKYY